MDTPPPPPPPPPPVPPAQPTPPAPPPPPAQPTPPPTGLTSDDKSYGMLCHLLALSGFVIPFGNVVGPLVLWLMKREQSEFVADQGKESLNFQITVLLAAFVGLVLTIVCVGWLVLVAVVVASLVFPILAGIKANEGVRYRYPYTLRLIK